jgi:membrane fusion protein (multidrug efflux system)
VVQRIPVKITLERDNGAAIELRPGMSVIPTIETKSHARVQARNREPVARPKVSNASFGG